jgi:hypothetical protein
LRVPVALALDGFRRRADCPGANFSREIPETA